MIRQNIKVTADIAVFCVNHGELQLLLIQRRNDPYKSMWCLPGGFIEDEEDLEAGARRELHEETGLSIEVLHQLHTFGAPGRDPRHRTITIVHYAILVGEPPIVAGGDDAGDARWYDTNALPQLGFDHSQIIQYAIERIREIAAGS